MTRSHRRAVETLGATPERVGDALHTRRLPGVQREVQPSADGRAAGGAVAGSGETCLRPRKVEGDDPLAGIACRQGGHGVGIIVLPHGADDGEGRRPGPAASRSQSGEDCLHHPLRTEAAFQVQHGSEAEFGVDRPVGRQVQHRRVAGFAHDVNRPVGERRPQAASGEGRGMRTIPDHSPPRPSSPRPRGEEGVASPLLPALGKGGAGG